jgi:predicted PolB exonuclease-like 3'-5' exonuclease
MRFSVFALSSVPDTATTRELFDLNDLDDKSVSKVLFHRRKQQTGSSEILRWDQRAIASLTLIQHSVQSVHIQSMNLSTHDEAEMLHAFFAAILRDGRMVSWGGEQTGMPLVHFRALKHTVSYPAYWQSLKTRGEVHLDIRSWLSPPAGDMPGLDETTRKLGFPGLAGRSENDVLDAWLKGRHEEVQAFSDVSALNVYLLALRLFSVTGELTRHDNVRVKDRLRDELTGRKEAHMTEFLAAWRKG